jgi:amino acid transporter
MLQQQMKNRHLQMIAVGGSIGTGLFIGSGELKDTTSSRSRAIADEP